MNKGKKIYNLTIVFDDKKEEVEELVEEMYEENPLTAYEEALSTLETKYPDAPPDWFKEIINEYYHSLLDDSPIYGIA